MLPLQQVGESNFVPSDEGEDAPRGNKTNSRPPGSAIRSGEGCEWNAIGIQRRRRFALGGDAHDNCIAGLTGKIVRKKARTIRPMWVERIDDKGKRLAIEAVPE